jgi:uncharacterized protein YndB with AHSA1/START domain
MAKKKPAPTPVVLEQPSRKFEVQLPACVKLTIEAWDEQDALARYLQALGATSTRCRAEIREV